MKNTDDVFSVATAEDSSGFLLWQVTSLWQRGLKRMLEQQHGITHPQYVLLASLRWFARTNPTITQVDLATHSKMDVMTTSTVLRTLQQKGLLKRTEHPKDTRAKVVELTPKGIELIDKAIPAVETFDKQFFGVLGLKTKELNSLLLELSNLNH